MTQAVINKILKDHQHWLNKDVDGYENMRADLTWEILAGAELSRANLSGAVLTGAKIDKEVLDEINR